MHRNTSWTQLWRRDFEYFQLQMAKALWIFIGFSFTSCRKMLHIRPVMFDPTRPRNVHIFRVGRLPTSHEHRRYWTRGRFWAQRSPPWQSVVIWSSAVRAYVPHMVASVRPWMRCWGYRCSLLVSVHAAAAEKEHLQQTRTAQSQGMKVTKFHHAK